MAEENGAFALPPEGVEWANRWAELENATAAAEAEREALKAEISQLRRANQAMSAASTSAQAAAVDSEELKSLRSRLNEAQRQAETRLHDLAAARTQATDLSEQMQARTRELAELTQEHKELQTKMFSADAELLPIREEAGRLKRERDEFETRAQELETENANLRTEHDKLFLAKADESRKLTEDAVAAAAAVEEQRRATEAAREEAVEARKDVAEARRELSEKVAALEADRAMLQQQLERGTEHTRRTSEILEEMQRDLIRSRAEHATAVEGNTRLQAELAAARSSVEELQAQVRRLEAEKASLLSQALSAPAAADAPAAPQVSKADISGFASLSLPDLVRQTIAAKEEALTERQARQLLETSLQEVERSVRQAEPRLRTQREELQSLRSRVSELSTQGEGLLRQLHGANAARRSAEARAGKAERSEKVLERHARDMARQLGVLIDENGKLMAAIRAPGKAAEVAAPYLSARDLAEQNESLRKVVAGLTEDSETSSQRELQAMKDELEQHTAIWKQQLDNKESQIAAVLRRVERLTLERDEAVQEKQQLAEKVQASAALPVQAAADETKAAEAEGQQSQAVRREAALRQQLKAVRAEFAKCKDALLREAKELRTSDLDVRKQLTETQGRLDFEVTRRASSEARLNSTVKTVEELRSLLRVARQRLFADQDRRGQEESSAMDLEASLGQARRDITRVEAELQFQRSRTLEAERSNARLLDEKAASAQLVVDLHTRATLEGEACAKVKEQLETAYRKEEVLLRQQLGLAESRQGDLKRSVEELGAALRAREAEFEEARKKAADLEEAKTKMAADLARAQDEVQELRAAGAARPRRGRELSSEARSQLFRAASPRADEARDTANAQVEERSKELARSTGLWKGVIATRERELAAKEGELAEVRQGLEAQKSRTAELGKENEQLRASVGELQGQLASLRTEEAELRENLQKKEAEVVEALKEGERKSREAEAAQREREGRDDTVEGWKEKHRLARLEHGQCLTELEKVEDRSAALEKELAEVRQEATAFRADSEKARAFAADEAAALRKRAAVAEEQLVSLSGELQVCHERLRSGVLEGGATQESSKRIREVTELRQQVFEAERSRLQRTASDLRAEVARLQQRLEAESERVALLQGDARRNERATTRLARVDALEDEKRRLSAEIKSLEVRVAEADEVKARADRLERACAVLQKREKAWDQTRSELEAKVEEFAKQHADLKSKLPDMEELKRLREEQASWKAKNTKLSSEFASLQAELKKAEEKASAQGAQPSSKDLQDLQKQLEECKSQVEKMRKTEKQGEAIKQLHLKRNDELTKVNAELTKQVEELRKSRDELAAQLEESRKQPSQAKAAASAASVATSPAPGAAAGAKRPLEAPPGGEGAPAKVGRTEAAGADAPPGEGLGTGPSPQPKRAPAGLLDAAKLRQQAALAPPSTVSSAPAAAVAPGASMSEDGVVNLDD